MQNLIHNQFNEVLEQIQQAKHKAYQQQQKLSTVWSQLSWSHNRRI